MSGTGGPLNDKIDLAPWGYAPGISIATCADCSRVKPDPEDAVFIGHKYAHRCAEHALIARQSVIRAYEGELVPDPDQQIADEALAMIRAASDRGIRQAFIISLVLSPIFVGLVLWL
jgi:hypothetical protein